MFEMVVRKGIATHHSDARARYAVLKERAETHLSRGCMRHVAPELELDGGTRPRCPGAITDKGSLLQNRAVKTVVTDVRWCRSRPGRATEGSDWRGHPGSDDSVTPNNQ